MTNKQIVKSVFKYIQKYGFVPYNIEYGSSYFIFEMGDNSVVHFKVRGLRGWKFGMWINCGDKPLQFFTQHEDYIDKFKPSRSFFVTDYTKEEVEDSWENKFCEIVKILKHIKKHPVLAYEQNATGDIYCCGSGFYTIEYLKDKARYFKRMGSEKAKDIIPILQHKFKCKLLERYDIVDYVEFKDMNDGGWLVSPRYEMTIHFKLLFDENKQTNEEFDLLRKFFKKELYGYDNINISCCRSNIKNPYTYDLWKDEE